MKNLLFTLIAIIAIPFFVQAQAGCTDPNAHNYDPAAITNDGSCETCFDGVLNGDEFAVDCGGSNPNCAACILEKQLDVCGDAKILGSIELGGNNRDQIHLFGKDVGAADGYQIRYNQDFTGITNRDYLIFEKTDDNSTNPDGGIAFVNTGNDGIEETAMIIKGNGRVGIGTTDPQADLDVAGDLRVGSGGSARIAYLDPPFTDNGSKFMRFGSPTDFFAGFMNNTNNPVYGNGDDFVLFTYASRDMVLKPAGRLYIDDLHSIGDERNVQWDQTTGELGYDTSSKRYKENIMSLDGDHSNLLTLDPKIYNRIGEKNKWEIGFIAEEVHELGYEELVEYNLEGLPDGIDYAKFAVYLIPIIKNQTYQIEQLQQQVEKLTSKKKFRLFKKKK